MFRRIRRIIMIFLLIAAAAIVIDGLRPPEHQFVSRRLASFIGFYQNYLSPLLHLNGRIQLCRFHPTCSEYARQSLLKDGLYKGSAKSVWRVLRCNPFCKGGIDEP